MCVRGVLWGGSGRERHHKVFCGGGSGRERERQREREIEREKEEDVVDVVLFYAHGKQLWSCRDGQLT